MDDHGTGSGRLRTWGSLARTGRRAVTQPLRWANGAAAAAIDATVNVERRAVVYLLDRPETERLISAAINSPRVQTLVRQALATEGARQLVVSVFDTGLVDEFANRLLADRALWMVVDEVVESPAVTDAITTQGLGFADQVGEHLRTHSRGADEWLEHAAARVTGRRAASSRGPSGQESNGS